MRSRIKKWILVFLSVSAVLGGIFEFAKWKTNWERARWKNVALAELTALTRTNEVIRQELDGLKQAQEVNGIRRWTGDHVLLMTNGEFIIYAYRHGANDGFPDHLFLGHCSDGRWLYSTFHFCNYMNMVSGEDAPGSIVAFAKTYSARDFDGKSDECLKRTWPVYR
jgi:hypothetical protein